MYIALDSNRLESKMKFIAAVLFLGLSSQAHASDTCEQAAEKAAKAIAKINNSHARILTYTEPSADGQTVDVTLDNSLGGQSVTYTVTLTDTDPCQISKVEITGEE